GVLELKIYTSSTKWLEVSKTVFTAYGMEIYYKDDLVSLKGTIKIRDEDLSETNFLDKPLEKYMEKAPEIYQAKKQPLKGSKFVMEGGL
ncbi:MAG: DUF432 domain-containing protein, partial [Thermoplasmatota archaeon]